MINKLHHYSQINAYQFVTFRTLASVDDYLLKINESTLNESSKQLQIDNYLDKSDKGRVLNSEVIRIVLDYCKTLETEYYNLICISVMPNHIHMLFKQNQNMPKIVQKLKGGLSFLINKHLNQKGKLWDENYFDKAIRDERHFQVTYDYIKNNAVKAGLADAKIRFYGVFE